jgi:hypothetical protein
MTGALRSRLSKRVSSNLGQRWHPVPGLVRKNLSLAEQGWGSFFCRFRFRHTFTSENTIKEAADGDRWPPGRPHKREAPVDATPKLSPGRSRLVAVISTIMPLDTYGARQKSGCVVGLAAWPLLERVRVTPPPFAPVTRPFLAAALGAVQIRP